MLPEPSNESVVSTAVTEHQHMELRDGLGEDAEPPERKVGQARATPSIDWDHDPRNPWNWPLRKKIPQLLMLSSAGFLATTGTATISPAHDQIMNEFGVSSTAAHLPLVLYVFAMGFGPVVGGPLSETVGRYPVYLSMIPLGALVTVGAGLTHNFGALCFFRFLAGFFWGPALAVVNGSLSETFRPETRGPFMALVLLMPFIGTGFGPVFGAFAAHRKGWRWTQWTIIFIAISTIVTTLLTEETFHSTIQRRIAKKRGEKVAELPPLRHRLREFAVVGLVRPIHMLFLEPIVAFTSLYVSAGFGVLFSFFAALPYTFGSVYGFTTEQSGLVFLPIVVGCVLGFATLVLCDLLIYRPLAVRSRPRRAAPEHRLYAAMIGSVGFPLGLFWFAWTARPSVSWASPAAAVVPFAWGNLCLFVSVVQYMADTYQGTVVASAGSANSLARYAFAGAFPLFITQMFEKLGIAWGASLLGFLSLALLPIPWVLFKYGPTIRSKSKYETVRYED